MNDLSCMKQTYDTLEAGSMAALVVTPIISAWSRQPGLTHS